MVIINLHSQLNNFINRQNWSNTDKTSEATLTDINRTMASFGNVPIEVIQAEAEIGFKKEDGVFKKEKRLLTEAEKKLLFGKVCKQLFKNADLTEEQEKDYHSFLSRHLHQGALYHQGGNWLQAQLPDGLLICDGSYEVKLEFKNGILYLNDTYSSDKYVDASGNVTEGLIAVEVKLKLEIKNKNANVAVNDFSINYSPEWEQFLGKFAQPEKKSNSLSFLRGLPRASFFGGRSESASEAQVESQQTMPACSK